MLEVVILIQLFGVAFWCGYRTGRRNGYTEGWVARSEGTLPKGVDR